MREGLRRAAREPLLQFLVLGLLIFAVQSRAVPSPEPEERRIEISRAEVESLAAMWAKQYGRPPTGEELRGALDDRVREEVLAREAVRLGLDRGDVVVRRRLAQKMEFLLEDTLAVEPAPEELRAFFAERSERYGAPARVSFRQVFFSPERRSDAEGDARAALSTLGDEASGEGGAIGDPFLLGDRHGDLAETEVAALFGPDFAAAVFALPPGPWQGPVASAYGLHLVRLEARTAAEPARFEEIEERVALDWRYLRRVALEREVYERLLEGYEIDLPVLDAEAPAGG